MFGGKKWRYVLRADKYSTLSEAKVLDEASAHSGIGRGALKGAWDAIGEVVKNWLTEGHSVPLPGVGTMRFSLQSKAVEDVNDVASSLIRARKIVYTPETSIKQVLQKTNVSITCIDRNGEVVKRVQDQADNETIEDGDGDGDGNGSSTGGSTGGSDGDDGME